MLRIGYTLSSEEHSPNDLVKYAALAEEAGFSFVSVSDHFHPWVDEQGQSPFVWTVIGGISQVTKTVNVLVGVTCPIIRIHPVIIAQAAATSQVMLEGRFLLGVGSGENLNEHVVGQGWPPVRIRREMLNEAIVIIRLLLQGGYRSYFGKYFSVDAARIYTLPANSIPIIYSAFGPVSAKSAGHYGDGFITTSPDKNLVETFLSNGGSDKPVFGQFHIAYNKNRQKAEQILLKQWPNSAMPKPLATELRLPQDFEKVSKLISIEDATQRIPIGDNPENILKTIYEYKNAGFDHIYIHQIGENQEEFLKFAKNKILPFFKERTKAIRDTKIKSPYITTHKIRR